MAEPTSDAEIDDASILALARALLDLDIPGDCLPGVRENLALLAKRGAIVAPPTP